MAAIAPSDILNQTTALWHAKSVQGGATPTCSTQQLRPEAVLSCAHHPLLPRQLSRSSPTQSAAYPMAHLQ